MKRVCGIFTILVTAGLLVACVGGFEYVRPRGVETATLSRIVAKSIEEVWRQASAISVRGGFSVDGLDKDAGVVTLLYHGDPERYVDCGYIMSYVENVRGKRTYRFPAATAATDYELMTGKEIVSIARQMMLDARIAVTVTPMGSKETRLSASAQYVLSRTMHIRDTQGSVQTISHLTRFTSDQDGTFPGAIMCRANGALEADGLSAFTP